MKMKLMDSISFFYESGYELKITRYNSKYYITAEYEVSLTENEIRELIEHLEEFIHKP